MGFDMVLGLALIAIGALIIMVAFVHPAPQTFSLARLFAWPRTDQDRADLLLSGAFHIALGTFLAALATEASGGWLLAPLAVLLVTGLALGVRRRDASLVGDSRREPPP